MSHTSLKQETEESSEKRHVDLPVYPKPLPERDISRKVDENQFTMAEKAALRNAWRFIEPFQRRFGQETFYSFLTTHQDLINFFRRDGKINMSKLHGHAMAMMKLMGRLIHTLDFNLQFRMALDENLPSHMKNGIDSSYMKMLASALKSYILESSVIENHKSCTLTSAFTRLVQIIEEYAEVDEARKRAFSTALRQTIDILGSQAKTSL
ncbi:uncharacterized protein LOC110188774 [Drosophila serrata]|uniref:uncharacterized protein LOC110188774 n=1 Tax=Drosophila serrata TaxID=7274 RepID=UPI000A1D3263|nr:uncharacterized protein LOC110188774 [Drosophila serrata]